MKLNTKSLAQVEIGIPVISDGLYHARIEDAEVKPNKAGTGNNLAAKFKILDPVLTLHKDGSEIANKGQFVMMRHFSLVPTPDYDPDKAMKELAVAIRHPEDADLELSDLKGKVVMVKVAYKPEQAEERAGVPTGKTYPEGNDIKRITPLAEDDNFQSLL